MRYSYIFFFSYIFKEYIHRDNEHFELVKVRVCLVSRTPLINIFQNLEHHERVKAIKSNFSEETVKFCQKTTFRKKHSNTFFFNILNAEPEMRGCNGMYVRLFRGAYTHFIGEGE